MGHSPLLHPDFAMPDTVLARAQPTRLVLLDVDGVLTDGRVILGAEDEYKAFDIKDGLGMRLLQQNGVEIGILTGRTSRAVARRAAELGVRHIYQGCVEKLPRCRQLLDELGLAPQHAAYVGDDVIDLPVMLYVGLGIAVRDAHALVRRHAHWITPSAGGRGAVRDTCELILHAQGKYEAAMRRYLGGAGTANA